MVSGCGCGCGVQLRVRVRVRDGTGYRLKAGMTNGAVSGKWGRDAGAGAGAGELIFNFLLTI